MQPAIGIVGVGRMGANMGRRLRDQGFSIAAIYDVSQSLAESVAAELSAISCTKLSEVTRLSDMIITVVSDDRAMEAIFYAPQDNLFEGANGKLFINCATISPSVHVELKQKADSIGAQVLECPMASSITQVREGTLYLMCAGEPGVYEKAKPVLDALSVTTVFTGSPGSAASMKALVNMVMNINTAALAEGLGLADSLGLDLNLVRQVFAQTGANSRVLETDGEDMQNRDHATYFSAAHAAKDSGIALALGQQQKLPMSLTKVTKDLYEQMNQYGLGELDKSGISELTFKSRFPDGMIVHK